MRGGYRWNVDNQSGGTLLLVTLTMVILLGVAAFAIDFGYRHVTKNELQNIADGAALAGGRQLGVFYQALLPAAQQTYDPSTSDVDGDGAIDAQQIIQVAQSVGTSNKAAQQQIAILASEVEIGTWISGTFTQTYTHPNAVRVMARRDTTANSPITTFFARILNTDTMNVTASAIAALTPQSTAAPGEIQLPVGIDECWFLSTCGPTSPANCGSQIKFYPTSSCAGWTGFDDQVNTPNMRDLIDGVADNPQIIANDGTDWYFGGGVNATLFLNLINAFKREGWDVDSNGEPIRGIYDTNGNEMHVIPPGTLYPDGSAPDIEQYCLFQPSVGEDYYARCSSASGGIPLTWPDGSTMNVHLWETTVVVYESNGCGNPNQTMKIVGFAKILIRYIGEAPEKTILGELECNSVSPKDTRGSGGGSYGGLMGSIPNLVQ